MGKILELPPSVINQIAAGEVVERPASVVKELLENAVDSGATRVELSVERGGKDLVRVADDGSGMEPDDLILAFRPHATSKLKNADDLFRVRTLGFRGEALAAIAEVSRVRCQTRTAEATAGSELSIEGGVASPVKPCANPAGTVIEVRNLFYNTPVRRTFLKSDSTEAGHVAEMFVRIALANPDVHFTYRTAGKIVHDLPPASGLRDRVAVFFGQELAERLLWVESRIETIHIRGYVAHPSQSRSSNKGQYLFVGGRYVRDRSLGHALSEAYRGLLMVGRYPLAFLFLDLPPEEVDVNVHPTKVEVRFRDGHRVYSQLLSTIRQTFLTSDLHSRLQAPVHQETEPSPTPSRTGSAPSHESTDSPSGRPPTSFELAPVAPTRQEVAAWFQPSTVTEQPATPLRPLATMPEGFGMPVEPDWVRRLPPADTGSSARRFDEFDDAGEATKENRVADSPAPTQPSADSSVPPRPHRTTGHGDAISPGPALKALQVHDSYLIAETEDGMVVIDQHALHERILYEELKLRVEEGGVEAQRLLVPEPVELSPPDAAEVLQRRDVLARLGLGIEEFGGDTVLVTSTPAMLSQVEPTRLLRDLADHFRGGPVPPTADAVLEDVLNMVACKAAVKAGQRLSTEEVEALLERRHLVANTHHCPHGRPTALTFSKTELERQFGRI